MPTSLQGRAEKAKRQATYRFRNLDGRLTEERLKDCWRDIRKDAAYGVEEVSAQASEQDLDEHISDLGERLKRKRSRAKLVSRHDLPKGDGRLRPLGRPAVDDKRL
jgi:retron-type reverse transcriptase